MTQIVGIAGSLRSESFNAALLETAGRLFPEVITGESIRGVPLYDADVETQALPAEVSRLQRRIMEADGLLLVTPEYNNSVPGVLKNAIDWISRPAGDVRNVFHGKPIAVIGASPGRFGTILSQDAWLPVFRALRARLWLGGRLMVSHAHQVFDEDGRLADPELEKRLESYLRGFIEYIGH
ncbi:MAG: NADPH-dependent FMN reductase [Lysobacterales bacterium]|jgi:NAD(P)H-dependent FMN reductase